MKKRIEAYIDGDKITYIPRISGKTEYNIIQAEPFHSQLAPDEESIGNKVIEIMEQIERMETDKETSRIYKEANILKAIGYKSWAQVKKNTDMLSIYMQQEEDGAEIVHIEPWYPTGRGYQYIGCEEEECILVEAVQADAIGSAVIDRIKYLKKRRKHRGYKG